MKLSVNYYEGTAETGQVLVNGNVLDPCFSIFNHSPTGFSWGYGGSGSAQLALAVMVCEFGPDISEHPLPYQAFKEQFIAMLDMNLDFSFTSDDVLEWLASQPHIAGSGC